MKSAPERLWPVFLSKLIGRLPYVPWTVDARAATGGFPSAPSVGLGAGVIARSIASPDPTPNRVIDHLMSFSFSAPVRAPCVDQKYCGHRAGVRGELRDYSGSTEGVS